MSPPPGNIRDILKMGHSEYEFFCIKNTSSFWMRSILNNTAQIYIYLTVLHRAIFCIHRAIFWSPFCWGIIVTWIPLLTLLWSSQKATFPLQSNLNSCPSKHIMLHLPFLNPQTSNRPWKLTTTLALPRQGSTQAFRNLALLGSTTSYAPSLERQEPACLCPAGLIAMPTAPITDS